MDLLPAVNLEPSYLSLLEEENASGLPEQGPQNESRQSADRNPVKSTLKEGDVSLEKNPAEGERGDSVGNVSSEDLPRGSKAEALNASSSEDFPSEEEDITFSVPCDSDANEVEGSDSGRRGSGDSESDRPPSRMEIEWEDDYVRMPACDAKKVG